MSIVQHFSCGKIQCTVNARSSCRLNRLAAKVSDAQAINGAGIKGARWAHKEARAGT